MSALAVFFERKGLATVVIGLIRLHMEKIRPPRGLWVPFELGRPLGAYIADGEFQKDILRHAFKLFDRQSGPVILEDFEFDDPGAIKDKEWQPPAISATGSMREELEQLMPFWQRLPQGSDSPMTGLSGLSLFDAADYLEKFVTESPAVNPNSELSDLMCLRFSADDIKTFYTQVAMFEGLPNSAQITDWFWNDTRAGETLRKIHDANLDHEDSKRATVCTNFLIPRAYRE